MHFSAAKTSSFFSEVGTLPGVDIHQEDTAHEGKKKKRLRQLPGLTPADQKRLQIHQRLLERVDAAVLAYNDAIAVAKALDRLAEEAAVAAQNAHWESSEARKQFAAHKDIMIAATAKEKLTLSTKQPTQLKMAKKKRLSDADLQSSLGGLGKHTRRNKKLIETINKTAA